MIWADVKVKIQAKSLLCQYEEETNYYRVWANDGPNHYETTLIKDPSNQHIAGLDAGTAQTDLTDFETNFKPTANQVLERRGSDGTPLMGKVHHEGAKNVELITLHLQAPPPVDPDTELATVYQWKTPIQRDFYGVSFWVWDANWNDEIDLDVVDVDGVYYPAGTVVGSYTKTIKVYKDMHEHFESEDKANIAPNLYFRLTYTNRTQGGTTAKAIAWPITKK